MVDSSSSSTQNYGAPPVALIVIYTIFCIATVIFIIMAFIVLWRRYKVRQHDGSTMTKYEESKVDELRAMQNDLQRQVLEKKHVALEDIVKIQTPAKSRKSGKT